MRRSVSSDCGRVLPASATHFLSSLRFALLEILTGKTHGVGDLSRQSTASFLFAGNV